MPHKPRDNTQVDALVAHLFRHQSGQLTATLTRIFGFAHIDLVEDVVAETLLKALKTWPTRGVPDNPAGWIMTAARNLALDRLRRHAAFERKTDDIAVELTVSLAPESSDKSDATFRNELRDDMLGMIFACCHPELSREAQVALTLKTLAGFSVAEIAAAFLEKEPTVAQRIVRAKKTIRDNDITLEVPPPDTLEPRLDAVLETVYFLFNEGYTTHTGESHVRADLVEEALRLVNLLLHNTITARPRVFALKALICFHAARLPSRINDHGELLLLEEQDRARWDQELITDGLTALEKSMTGDNLTEYHLLAGIASEHATAGSWDSTNWENIAFYYDQLVAINHSPVIALNRAVAIALAGDPEKALATVDNLAELPKMSGYHLYHASRADLLRRLGKYNKACPHYVKAIELTQSKTERRYLQSRLQACRDKSES